MALPTNTTPMQLNKYYEELMYIWDRLLELPHPDVVDIVNNVFNEFQDWFWGQYERWDMNELPIHIDRYNRIQPVILDWISKTTILDEPVVEQPRTPGEIIHLPPEYVTGRVPIKPAGISKGMFWTIAGILATIFLSKAA